ncbi:uncharacterized protein LOC112349641 isoform X1 [Selaginella moellendorffii]|uniref:uncharacterized protein LOC112349641 isoform X1 n=1 Tax=Selaginella moellendorffii TaxID=88036 RepID=UPI000D1C3957|nr:uncharacterized protein LOC112349641 isoform X1 [Selaginella moellendorffii]|eukprot:XP_024540170.1 uncharacterized protein LOC112349641 isoform X1 [Selaginella moellendorffii]
MAPSGKARHRSHRHRRDAEEELEEEQEGEEDDSVGSGTVARRKSSSSKRRDSGEKEKERDEAKRGHSSHKRKHSSDVAAAQHSSHSTKKTRSGENEGVVVSAPEKVLVSCEKKDRKSDHGRSSDSGPRHKKSKEKKHSVADRDGDRNFTDLESDRYCYNAEDEERHYSRDHRDEPERDRERDGDDRKDRDRGAKHREHKDERSKRSHSDVKHTDPDQSKDSRKKSRDNEDQTRPSKEEDGHHKESKHRSRDDDQERRSNRERNHEVKSSKDERSHRAHEEERRVNGGERHEEKQDKDKLKPRSDGERERKDRDGERERKDRDGERERKDRNGERERKDRDGERERKDRDGERERKDRDGERERKDTQSERSRVSSREESRTKDSERRSPGDDYSSRKDKRKHESDYRERSRSRDRSNEDDYRRRQRYYKYERDERSHHYRDYRDEDYKRSSDERSRRGPSSSGRPDDYSRRGGSYRRRDGAEEPWNWKNGFFPPFAPHYGVGGFLEHFPASIYGSRGSIYCHPSRFMRDPASFVGEDGYSHPWYNAATMEHFREPKDQAPLDEHALQASPENKYEEPTGGKNFSLKDARFTEDMRQLMSRLSVSKELAGPEAYEEYLKFMTDEKIEAPDVELEADEPAMASDLDDDFVLEADPEGEDLLREVDGHGLSEPPFLSSPFEDALKLYRKPEEENRLRKSLVGSFLLPLECVSLLQSEEEAHPSHDFSETAKREESGVEYGTGDDPSVVDGRHTRGETAASQEAGEALKVVTDINGGGDFSWEKKTNDIVIGLEVADDRKNVTNIEERGRDNPGSDDRHLDYNVITSSGSDGDEDGVQGDVGEDAETLQKVSEAHEEENLRRQIEQEATGVVSEVEETLAKAEDDWTEGKDMTPLEAVEQLEGRTNSCQLDGVLESLEHRKCEVEATEVIARLELEARDQALEPVEDLEAKESTVEPRENRIELEAGDEALEAKESTVEPRENRIELEARDEAVEDLEAKESTVEPRENRIELAEALEPVVDLEAKESPMEPREKLEARDEALELVEDLEAKVSTVEPRENRIQLKARDEQSGVKEVTAHEHRDEAEDSGKTLLEAEDISREDLETREASGDAGENPETPKGMSSPPQDERKHLGD